LKVCILWLTYDSQHKGNIATSVWSPVVVEHRYVNNRWSSSYWSAVRHWSQPTDEVQGRDGQIFDAQTCLFTFSNWM